MRLARWALLAALAAGGLHAADELAESVREAHLRLKQFEELYRSEADERARHAALERIVERAAWLEQVGGLSEARVDQILAVARLQMRGESLPPRYGYLLGPGGAVRAELTAQPWPAQEIPPNVKLGAHHAWLVRLTNRGDAALKLLPPCVLEQPGVSANRREALAAERLPEGMEALADLAAWPAELAGGASVSRVAVFPKQIAEPTALGLRVAGAGEGTEAEWAVVPFPEAQEPDVYAVARRESVRLEKLIAAERARRSEEQAQAAEEARKRAQAQPDAEAPSAPAARRPAEDIPPALGEAERAGAGTQIQVRMYERAAWEEGQVLRVRKNGRWVGRVRVPNGAAPKWRKSVYWFELLEGEREVLNEGTLHAEG